MPGVIVRTETRTGPTTGAAPTSARFFVAGLTERGDTSAPVLIRSMAEYQALLGDRVAYGSLYDALACYFEEGGSEAFVCRAVGAAATVGTLTLKDRAGAPADTLRVDAANAGAWSSRVTVEIVDGSSAGTYRLNAYLDGTLVHAFDNLTTPADAAAAAKGSNYVLVTDLGSASAAPTNQPALLIPTALTAGTDDRASVTAADVAAALDLAGHEYGDGAVATPGYTSGQVGDALLAHATVNNRVALLATASAATVADAKAAALALTGVGNEYGALFYPWVTVPDGTSTRTISPEGYVAACRARAHKAGGPWNAPAGDVASARYVLAPAVTVDRTTGDDLDTARVSAIRTIASETRLYGWRSLSSDDANYALLTGRDTLNYLAVEGENVLEQYVFKTIDGRGQLLSRVASTLVGLLDPIRAVGGLYERLNASGEQVDPGYSIDVGPSVNTDAVLGAGKIAARVSVRVSPSASLVDLTIVKAGFTAGV